MVLSKPEKERNSTRSSSLSPVPSEQLNPGKKRKRAETRPCPVCDEPIPLRLLPLHAQLETERVEEICSQVGSLDILYDNLDYEPGPSSRSRRSAIKARKSFSNSTANSLEQVDKTLQTIKRHRRQRHTKFREIIKEEEDKSNGRDIWSRSMACGEIVCPVCSTTVRGDVDVLDAHVDSCLANESIQMEEERRRVLQQRRAQDEDIWDDDLEGNGGHVGNVRGTGFHTRDRNQQDVDDDVDVDGDDQELFGEPQFTEGDILPVDVPSRDVEPDVEVDILRDEEEAQREQKSLRDLVAEGKVIMPEKHKMAAMKAKMEKVMGLCDAERLEIAITAARKNGSKSDLISALLQKIKHLESIRVASATSLLCRICLDPYNEPTVSTGCWHTCCRECWLRCLGSTKLCPICKRITGATDLRRVYL